MHVTIGKEYTVSPTTVQMAVTVTVSAYMVLLRKSTHTCGTLVNFSIGELTE